MLLKDFHRRSIHRKPSAIAIGLVALVFTSGCLHSEPRVYSGPAVYLIEGDSLDESDGLDLICDELTRQEIHARVYQPDNWLRIVKDIEARPNDDVILVGHGHGAFLATQVVRHFAQRHKSRFIKLVITLDAYNKDWPHNDCEAGFAEPHEKPMPIPIGHNALCIRNYNQCNPESRRWGADLVSTRASNLADQHPYYWYDDWWNRRPVTGQLLAHEVTNEGLVHETIDNDETLVRRVIELCRRAALSPYHYTPPEHHPAVKRTEDRSVPRGKPRKST
ncbi:MAG: hypothetical protein KF841_05165 [Phycisphaerae bacterium]|nr:hypothetical protein [Phycisphaerae bacterium]